MVKYLFIGIAICGFLISCKPDSVQIEQANDLDSLKLLLDESERKLLAVDSGEVSKIYSTIMNDLETIQQAIKDPVQRDTILKEDAIILSDYRSIRKVFGKFNEQKKGLLEELDYTRSQLASLSNDIRKGLVKDETANRFYRDEYKAAKELYSKVEEKLESLKKVTNRFNELEPQVKAIMAEYNYAKKDTLINE